MDTLGKALPRFEVIHSHHYLVNIKVKLQIPLLFRHIDDLANSIVLNSEWHYETKILIRGRYLISSQGISQKLCLPRCKLWDYSLLNLQKFQYQNNESTSCNLAMLSVMPAVSGMVVNSSEQHVFWTLSTVNFLIGFFGCIWMIFEVDAFLIHAFIKMCTFKFEKLC